jgi:enterochelin esterase-like enzyme
MSVAIKNVRPHVWLEGLGEWSWPGRGGVAVEAMPPSWVPAFPPRFERIASGPAAAAPRAPSRSQRAIQRRLGAGALVSGLAAICAALTLTGPARLMDIVGARADLRSVPAHDGAAGAPRTPASARPGATVPASPPPPPLLPVSHDAAGSAIDGASYASSALHGGGSFLVYLPPGYGSTTQRYAVLYLLHGNGQQDSSFLHIGLQGMLDRLIARRAIPPLIAVMIQGGGGANNWRNLGARRYENYVLEVQEMVDRMLPTVAARAGRAIAGYSMGGYGAVHVALTHPTRFAVVESWLGFFDGLEADRMKTGQRPYRQLRGLHAFLYGGASDEIANPSENAPFAAALRAAGASADSAVYAGGHTFDMLHAHLPSMLAFAGRALAAGG